MKKIHTIIRVTFLVASAYMTDKMWIKFYEQQRKITK